MPKFLPSEHLSKRFSAAYEASRFSSLSSLSLASECAQSRAAKIASGKFDGLKDGPGVFGLWRMAENMHVSLNDLVPPARSIVSRPGVAAFFSRYKRGKSTLGDFSDVIDYCDVYLEPQAGRSRLRSVGAKSLLADRTGITDAVLLQLEYDQWPRDRRRAIFEWQRRAWAVGALAEPEYFEGSYASVRRKVNIPILRAACRVRLSQSEDCLVLYCDPLW